MKCTNQLFVSTFVFLLGTFFIYHSALGQNNATDFKINKDGSYLQYRTYSSSSKKACYQGRLNFKMDNGKALPTDSIQQISLQNSTGAQIDINNTEFRKSQIYWGSWNGTQAQVEYSGPWNNSGYMIELPQDTTLSAGNYTYNAITSEGESLDYTLNYPGIEPDFAAVNKSSIEYSWNNNGSLTISWKSPRVDFDGYMLYFRDKAKNKALLYIWLPKNFKDTPEVTIPRQIVKNIKKLYNSSRIQLQVQNIRENKNDMEYAKGVARTVIKDKNK